MENNTIHGIPSGPPEYQNGWFLGFNRLTIPVHASRNLLDGYEDGLSAREDDS